MPESRVRPGLACLATALIVLVVCLASGVPLAQGMTAGAVIALLVYSGGWLWVQCVRRSVSALEYVGMGGAIATVASIILGCVALPLGTAAVCWAWLVLPAGMVGWTLMRRRGLPSVQVDERRVTVGVGVGVVLGAAALLLNLARYPLDGPWSRYHPDVVFFEALGQMMTRFGPTHSILMTGDQIRYHWLAYLWSGQLTVGLHLDPFVAQTRVLPTLVLVCMAALAASWAARLTRSWWAPGLAVVLVVAGGFVGASYGTALNVDSPSLALTALWLMAAVVVVTENSMRMWLVTLLSGILGFALLGGKASSGAVLIVMLAAAAIIGAFQRLAWWRTLAASFIAATVGGGMAYLLLLRGGEAGGGLELLTWQHRASTVQGLDLGEGSIGILLGTLLLVLAVLPRWVGVMGLPREEREQAMAIGLVVAGLVPILVLSQGVNELWFAVVASAPLSVLSAVGLERRWGGRMRTPGLLAISAIVGLGAFVIAAILWSRGATNTTSLRALAPVLPWVGAVVMWVVVWLRWRQRALAFTVALTVLVASAALARGTGALGEVGPGATTGPPLTSAEVPARAQSTPTDDPAEDTPDATAPVEATPENPSPAQVAVAWTAAQQAAARWLAEHAAPSDVVLVSASQEAMLPAVTGLQTYISGASYQNFYGTRPATESIFHRVRVSTRFPQATTSDDVLELCQEHVTWAVVGPGAAATPVAEVLYANDGATVLRIRAGVCSQR